MKKIEEDINKLSLGINGMDRIKELCHDLKRKVKLKTDKFIKQLNEYNNEMISEIEVFEQDCIKSYKSKEKANNEFEKLKQELEAFNLKWSQYLRKNSSTSDEMVSKALGKADELVTKAKQDLAKLEEIVFNYGELKHETNEYEIDKSFLGWIVKKKSNIELTILSCDRIAELMDLFIM